VSYEKDKVFFSRWKRRKKRKKKKYISSCCEKTERLLAYTRAQRPFL